MKTFATILVLALATAPSAHSKDIRNLIADAEREVQEKAEAEAARLGISSDESFRSHRQTTDLGLDADIGTGTGTGSGSGVDGETDRSEIATRFNNGFGDPAFGGQPQFNQFGQQPFGAQPFGPNQFGPNQFGQQPFGAQPFGPNQFGPNQFGPNQFGQQPFPGQQQQFGQFGQQPFAPGFNQGGFNQGGFGNPALNGFNGGLNSGFGGVNPAAFQNQGFGANQAFNNNGFGLGGGRPLNSNFGPAAGFNNGFNGGLVNPGFNNGLNAGFGAPGFNNGFNPAFVRP